jgi:hypothetical protein
MSFDIDGSVTRARARLATGQHTRRQRSDRGKSRMDARAQAALSSLLSSVSRPRMRDVLHELRARARASGFRCPSRATVYNSLPRIAAPSYRIADLPDAARASLHNLDHAGEVPGAQLVFHLVNYGDTRALSFAASLPWLCLYQAERMRGFRPKSLGLLRALLRARDSR